MNRSVGFSIITVTNRKSKIENIIQNYQRQLFENKELIIIINKDSINKDEYYKYKLEDSTIKIFKLSQKINLGECLNFALTKSKYNYIAKFDDDDFYSKYYLNEIYKGFKDSGCKVVGKFKAYYYLDELKSLGEVVAESDDYENRLSHMLKGSALCFHKDVLKKVKFQNRNLAEDAQFCKACIKNGFDIYATSKYNHIIFRDKLLENHTWKEDTSFFLNLVNIVHTDVSFEECKSLVEKEF